MNGTVSSIPKKVLVLDDDEAVIKPIEHMLRLHHYQPITATQWTDALDVLEHEHPDLLLLDLTMPTIGGASILGFIRDRGYAVPVIIMSGSITDQVVEVLAPFGVEAFVEKPFEVSHLTEEIDRVIGPVRAGGPEVVETAGPAIDEPLLDLGGNQPPEPSSASANSPFAVSHHDMFSETQSDRRQARAGLGRKRYPSRWTRRNNLAYMGVVMLICLLLAGFLGLVNLFFGAVELGIF